MGVDPANPLQNAIYQVFEIKEQGVDEAIDNKIKLLAVDGLLNPDEDTVGKVAQFVRELGICNPLQQEHLEKTLCERVDSKKRDFQRLAQGADVRAISKQLQKIQTKLETQAKAITLEALKKLNLPGAFYQVERQAILSLAYPLYQQHLEQGRAPQQAAEAAVLEARDLWSQKQRDASIPRCELSEKPIVYPAYLNAPEDFSDGQPIHHYEESALVLYVCRTQSSPYDRERPATLNDVRSDPLMLQTIVAQKQAICPTLPQVPQDPELLAAVDKVTHFISMPTPKMETPAVDPSLYERTVTEIALPLYLQARAEGMSRTDASLQAAAKVVGLIASIEEQDPLLSQFIDPITFEPLRDPVYVISEGAPHHRDVFERGTEFHGINPLNRQRIIGLPINATDLKHYLDQRKHFLYSHLLLQNEKATESIHTMAREEFILGIQTGDMATVLLLLPYIRDDDESVLIAALSCPFLDMCTLILDKMHFTATYQSWLQNPAQTLENDPRARDAREIVLAAVQQNGWALRYASAALQNDRDIVLAAVMQNGEALHYASEALQHDPEILQAAKR